MIRRAASKVAPLAIRASIGSQRYMHHHHHGATVLAAVKQPSRNLLLRAFPSVARQYSTKPKSDESLLRVIKSEIQCALETQTKKRERRRRNPISEREDAEPQTINLISEREIITQFVGI